MKFKEKLAEEYFESVKYSEDFDDVYLEKAYIAGFEAAREALMSELEFINQKEPNANWSIDKGSYVALLLKNVGEQDER